MLHAMETIDSYVHIRYVEESMFVEGETQGYFYVRINGRELKCKRTSSTCNKEVTSGTCNHNEKVDVASPTRGHDGCVPSNGSVGNMAKTRFLDVKDAAKTSVTEGKTSEKQTEDAEGHVKEKGLFDVVKNRSIGILWERKVDGSCLQGTGVFYFVSSLWYWTRAKHIF